MLRAMAWIFDAEVRRSSRYSLGRGYADREESLTTIRGRIALGRQARIRQTQPLPLESDLQEYSEDIVLNRVIKSALRRLRVLSRLEPTIAVRRRMAETALAGVGDVDYPPANVP
jgi:5-methylcytosine-specific restriction enzyme subunit McrC